MRCAASACIALGGLLLGPAVAPALAWTDVADVAVAVPEPVAEMDLVADLSGITLRQARVIRRLIEAARATDELYRRQLEPGDPALADIGLSTFEAWPDEAGRVARLLAEAADITNDESLKRYLTLRARALLVEDHPRAEAAWQALQSSDVDMLVGPLGPRDEFGAYVLLRDWAWGARLARFTIFLPELQHELPVSAAFKDAVPAVDMKLAVYDLLFHGGYGMPRTTTTPESARDRRVRLEHGPRQLQLRNVMQARFEALVQPAAGLLLVEPQQAMVRFEPFFLNIMLRDMAHALGLQRTLDDRATVVAALGEHGAVIEEAKATVLSLWLAERLHARGELPETRLEEHYASFLAGILRSVQVDRFGVSGRARLLVFNHLRDWGAVRRDAQSGRYRIDAARMPEAIEALIAQLLTLQGSGDAAGAAALLESGALLRAELAADLVWMDVAALPTRIVFRQGEALLGL